MKSPGLTTPPRGASYGGADQLKRRHTRERHINMLLVAASAVSILTTVGIVGVLVFESLGFFAEVSPLAFLTGTQWTPLFEDQAFGVLPLLGGSLLVAGPSCFSMGALAKLVNLTHRAGLLLRAGAFFFPTGKIRHRVVPGGKRYLHNRIARGGAFNPAVVSTCRRGGTKGFPHCCPGHSENVCRPCGTLSG